jgi:MoxR-like ATPase
LPEAQLDRFMFKLLVEFSSRDELITILDRTTEGTVKPAEKVIDGRTVLNWREFVTQVVVAPHVKDYAVRLVMATHPKSEFATEVVKRYVRYGSSPRGAQAVTLAAKVRALVEGRANVSFEDVARALAPALRHRIIFNFEGDAEGVLADDVIDAVAKHVKRP